MKINYVAASFLHSKRSFDEEKRLIEYVLPKELKELESLDASLDKNLKLLSKKSEIKDAKELLSQREAELREVSNELLSMMLEASMAPDDRLETNYDKNIYFEVWYDKDHIVRTADTYEKT